MGLITGQNLRYLTPKFVMLLCNSKLLHVRNWWSPFTCLGLLENDIMRPNCSNKIIMMNNKSNPLSDAGLTTALHCIEASDYGCISTGGLVTGVFTQSIWKCNYNSFTLTSGKSAHCYPGVDTPRTNQNAALCSAQCQFGTGGRWESSEGRDFLEGVGSKWTNQKVVRGAAMTDYS